MAAAGATLDNLKETIALCRKRDLAFGLCLGKKPENTVLVTHKTKAPKVLGQQAKSEGETSHFTFGVMSVKGKDMSLSIQGKMPSGIHRKIKEMLKKAGVMMKVHILDPSGNPVEDDDPDQDVEEEGAAGGAGASDAAPEVEPEADPLAEKWAATVPEVDALIERVATRAGVDLGRVNEAWAKIQEVAESGKFKEALAAVPKLSALIKGATQAAAESPDQSDKQAAQWEAAKERLQPHVDEIIAQKASNAKKVGAVWNLAKSKAEAETPDYPAILKAVGMVANLVKEARAELEEKGPAPQASSAKPGTTSANEPKPSSAPAAEDPKPTDTSTTQEEPGDTPSTSTQAAPETAPASPPPAEPEAAPAQPAAAPDASDPIVASVADVTPDLSGVVTDKIDRLIARVETVKTGPVAAYDALIPEVKSKTVAEWKTELGRLSGIGEDMKTDPTTADEAALDAALTALAKLETKIAQQHAVKDAVRVALDMFDMRMVPIEAHPQAGARDIRNEIKALKDERKAAVAFCKSHEHRKALDALKAVGPLADAAELLADDYAHFDAIHLDRKTMSETYHGSPTTAATIDDLQAEIEKHYADAMTAKTAKDFKTAVAELDKIPDKFAMVERLRLRKSEYDKFITNSVPTLTRLNGLPEAERKPLQHLIDLCNTAKTDGDIATTGSYIESIKILRPIPDTVNDISRRLAAAADYKQELVDFDAKLKEFRDHPGTAGIADAIAAMENDRNMAEAEAKGNRPNIGIAILNRSQGDWPSILTRAQACEAYTLNHATVRAKIDGMAGQAGIAPLLVPVEELMSIAATHATSRDYVAAEQAVSDADARADAAKSAADAKEDLAKMGKDPALDNLDKDWDAAKKVYTDMRAKVAAKDTGGLFASLLTKADEALAKAETAHGSGLIGEAKAQITAATDMLGQAMDKALAHGMYDTHLTATQAEHTRLAGLSTAKDDCLKVFLDEATVHVTSAQDAIKDPAFDYATAETDLNAADVLMTSANNAVAEYDAISLNIQKAEASLVALAGEAAVITTQLEHHRVDVQGKIDEARRLIATGDFPGAVKNAADAAALEATIAEDITLFEDCNDRKTWWYDDELSKVTGPGTEAGADALKRAQAQLKSYEALIKAHNYKAAKAMILDVGRTMDVAIALIAAESTCKPAHDAAKLSLDAVVAVRNAHVEARVKALEDRFAAAEKQVDIDLYELAQAAFVEIKTEADALLPVAQASGTFEPSRKAAEDALVAAETHAHQDAIKAIHTRLRGKYDNAMKYAEDDDYALAEKMLGDIKTAADEAVDTANTHGNIETVNGMIGGDATSEPWQAQIELAKQSINMIERKDTQKVAQVQITTARDQITVAENSSDTASKTALLAALEACNTADAVIAQVTFVHQAIADARGLIADLKTHAHAAAIADDIKDMESKLATAETTANTGLNLDQVTKDVEAVMEAYHLLKAYPDFFQKFTDMRAEPAFDARLAELEAHDHRYAIKAEIDEMRKTLAKADTQAEERKLEEAIKSLDHARALGSSAKVLADMRDDTPPTEADLTKILAQPNGAEQLDEIIDKLEPEAQRKVVKVAFKARYGCDIENFNSTDFAAPGSVVPDGNLKGPNIVAFYKSMEDLPLDHTKDNDKMSKFNVVDVDAGGTSWYDGSEKLVVMDVGDISKSRTSLLASPDELGTPDEITDPQERAEAEDCQPANDDPVPAFNWTTLHEVGHAVDDKQHYMDRNGSKADHGGWIEHGADIASVAEKIAGAHKYDKAYVVSYMSDKAGNVPPPVPSSESCSEEEWEARRIAVCQHVDLCREDAAPWYSMATSRKITVGGRVYQEAYSGSWVSYPLKARSKGISGYQFRAPAEWFAELYAAYHSDKLKPSHPSISWLADL